MKKISLFILCLCLFSALSAQRTKNIAHPNSSNLCIMSYNTHNCIGTDHQMNMERIANVIKQVKPDIVALQELDSVTTRNNEIYTLAMIAQYTGMEYSYAPSIKYRGGKYGIGILSKEKPMHVTRIPLPGREEKRMLIIAEFPKYIFCATHFSLTEDDQKTSADIIAEQLNKLGKITKPVFLAGDMNSVPSSVPQLMIRLNFQPLTDSTWQTCEGKCIDYIYGYKSNGYCYKVIEKQVIDEETASDHRPISVVVRASRVKAAKGSRGRN